MNVAAAPGEDRPGAATAAAPGRIVLLGCVKTKQPAAAAAKELYVSQLWRGRRSYAERTGAPWFILSALHGLVRPDELIEPYNLALADLSARERRLWGDRVVAGLEPQLEALAGRAFEIHAGAAYRDALAPRLRSLGAEIAVPLLGLPLGRQLQWYREGA